MAAVIPGSSGSSGASAADDDANFHRGRAWLIASWLFVFAVVNFADKVVLGLVAVPMMQEFGFTATEFGLIGSSFFWLFSITGILGGFLADRVATKWLLLGMALIWAVAQLPIMFGSTIAVFLDDESGGHADTRAFLARRIDGIMRFEKMKGRILSSRDPERRLSLSRFIGRLRYPAV